MYRLNVTTACKLIICYCLQAPLCRYVSCVAAMWECRWLLKRYVQVKICQRVRIESPWLQALPADADTRPGTWVMIYSQSTSSVNLSVIAETQTPDLAPECDDPQLQSEHVQCEPECDSRNTDTRPGTWVWWSTVTAHPVWTWVW
jgi:hypothetical protein